jgi:hypothetical protein
LFILGDRHHASAGEAGCHLSVHITRRCGALCAFAPLRLCVEFSGHRKRCRWPLAFTASGAGTATASAAGSAAGLRSEKSVTLRGGDLSTSVEMTWVEERQGPSRAARSRARARAPARARCVGRVGSPSDTATVDGQSVGHRPLERDDLSPRRGRRAGCRSSRRSACVHSRGSTPRISRRSRLPSLGSHHSSVWRPLRLCAFAPLR